MKLISRQSYPAEYAMYYQSTCNNSEGGMCLGMCVTWLEVCLEKITRRQHTEKELTLHLDNNFFSRAAKKEHSLSAILGHQGMMQEFLKEMENENDRVQYPLNYTHIKFSQVNDTLNSLLNNEIVEPAYGLVFSIETLGMMQGLHALAILKINNKNYLFDPNLGVYTLNNEHINTILADLNRESYHSYTENGVSKLNLSRFRAALAITPG